MWHRRPSPTTLTSLLVAPLAAAALVACGSDTPASVSTDESSGSVGSSQSETTEPSDEGSGAASTDGRRTGDAETLLAAAATALASVDGTLVSIDLDDSGWDVSISGADGTETDLEVSADGSEITRDPVTEQDDADDLAEQRSLLDGASIDYAAAIEAAAAEGVGGPITGVDLDEDNGSVHWEVQYGEDTPDEQTVVVDAGSGEVLRTERDD